jgi:hypothetical protein
MAILYVATSKGLSEWGADVGLTKQLYKVGIGDESAEAILQALNDEACAGHSDWRLIKSEEVGDVDEEAAIARLAQRERMVDPALYPRIRGARGIFKIKLPAIANSLMVKRALAGEQLKIEKLKPADIAAYLMQNALGEAEQA